MKAGSVTGGRLKLSSLVLAGGGAVLAAWILAFLFWLPLNSGPIDRAAAQRIVERELGSAEITRAKEYQAGQRRIAAGAIAVEIGLLTLLAFWRPRPVRRLLERLGKRPVAGAAAVAVGLVLLLALAGIPLGLLALERGRDYGLVNQGVAGWFGDLAVSTGLSMLVAAPGAAAAMYLWRRLGTRFWLAAAALAAAWAVVLVWLWPVIVSPLFNRFEPLPDGPVRRDVLKLADRADVKIGDILVVDASRRSSRLNAYVDGVGSTRRVVIYDNALKDLSPDALRSLVAHELTHVKENDLPRGLLYAILVIPLAALTLQVGARLTVRAAGDDPSGPGLVPALALGLAVLTLVLGVPGNWLSRQVEASADMGALELAGSRGLVELQLGLARRNRSDPDPPAAWQFLFGTHPDTLQRIGMAEGGS